MLGRRNPLPSIHLGPSHDSHMAWAWGQHEKVKPHVKVDPRLEADWKDGLRQGAEAPTFLKGSRERSSREKPPRAVQQDEGIYKEGG